MINRLKNKFFLPGGYLQLLFIAVPLMLNTGIFALQHIINRIFLTWYSPEAVAAVMPAGMLNFSIFSIFLGTITYVGIFIAQYYGADQKHMIEKIIWQGIFLAFAGAFFQMCLWPLAIPFFNIIGHESLVKQYEINYFQILCLFALFPLLSNVLASYYSGIGKTWVLFMVTSICTFTNVLFDYLLIFGNWGFPEFGIKGAGYAIAISGFIGFVSYLCLILQEKKLNLFAREVRFKFEFNLFKKLIKYGFPQGLQIFLDMIGITIFVLLIGRINTIYLAASNIAFNINMIIFMPLTGIGIAVGILVAQNIGAKQINIAQKSVFTGFKVSLVYVSIIAFFCFFLPQIFLTVFSSHAQGNYNEIFKTAKILLKFVAIYSFFDIFFIIFSSAVRGAGDTHFIMKIVAISVILVLIIPTFFVLEILNLSVFYAWGVLVFYVFVLGVICTWRFKNGSWKKMKVIS